MVSFNPGYYITGSCAVVVGLTAIVWLSSQSRFPPALLLAGWIAVLVALWWLIGSLIVIHWVYDCSDLYRWNWLERIVADTAPGTAVVAHSGLNEVSPSLRARFPDITWRVCDFYDPVLMNEPSIHRARRLYPPSPDQERGSFDSLPYLDRSIDLVLFIASAHELRKAEQRTALLREARRCLSSQGRIVLIEHVRDLANFIAFGPGFLHFHSPVQWKRDWTAAGLAMDRSFRITPFVRGYVLRVDL